MNRVLHFLLTCWGKPTLAVGSVSLFSFPTHWPASRKQRPAVAPKAAGMPPSQGIGVSKKHFPISCPGRSTAGCQLPPLLSMFRVPSPKSNCRDVQSDSIFKTDGRTLVLEVPIPLEVTRIKLGQNTEILIFFNCVLMYNSRLFALLMKKQ